MWSQMRDGNTCLQASEENIFEKRIKMQFNTTKGVSGSKAVVQKKKMKSENRGKTKASGENPLIFFINAW